MRAIHPIRALPLLILVFLAHPAPASSSTPPDSATSPAATSAPPPADDPYLLALLSDARRLELHKDPYWHILLHYKDGLLGFRSLVDDPSFFLSENGKHDPEAELEATLRAFFAPEVEYEKHAACRFVGRFEWLKAKLEIDELCLPVPRCEPFDALVDQIAPDAVTLIFPASHMNSPASMYGHTLLTIRTDSGSDLLSYAVNYAAQTGETFGPLYIMKGLIGSYKGYFSILPYYIKLQEYSDVNDRDIWEYALDLNDKEIRRLLAHIYEMQEIYSDYYFFSENCSYDLLFLLDAARPGLDLTDQCAWWVIPVDTIREVKKKGLIREAVYRPSRSTKITHLMSLLPENGQRSALAIVEGEMSAEEYVQRSVPAVEKARVVDLASEFLQYTYATRELEEKDFVDRFMKTLTARSTLGAVEDEAAPKIAVPDRPDEGHHSGRASVGFGGDENGPIQEIRIRPAYHTLLDNDAGYKRGSQIVFMDFVVRYHSQDEKLELEQLNLVDIVSIAPRNAFFKHTSWKVKTDFFQRTVREDQDYLVYRFNTGFGRAHDVGFLGLCYGLVETEVHVSGVLDGNYSVGAGLSIGTVMNLTRAWKIQLQGRDVYHALGDTDNLLTAELGQNFQIHTDMSISAEILGHWNDHDEELEGIIRWNAFF